MEQKKKKFLILGIVILCVLLGLSVAFIPAANKLITGNRSGSEGASEQSGSETDNGSASGSSDGGGNGLSTIPLDTKKQDELKTQIAQETDQTKKTELSLEYVDNFINAGKYDEALKAGLEIEASNPTNMSAGTVAHIYELKGDYSNAVKYYDLAMQRSEKPASESENSPYNDYKALKKAAEAKS